MNIMLKKFFKKITNNNISFKISYLVNIDSKPWNHPFLTHENIKDFRNYSKKVWEFANEYSKKSSQPFSTGFYVNMAQNMYKWATLAQKYGVNSELISHPQDSSALNLPQWEEFDGDFYELQNGKLFLEKNPNIKLKVPCINPKMDDNGLLKSYIDFNHGFENNFMELIHNNPTIKYETLLKYDGHYPYFELASKLSNYDVIYAASTPFAAYVSGKPYCVCSVGGDLQYDCGRNDDYGMAIRVAFNCAKFLFISNPHTLGHSRRLGFTNGVYLPYPMDTSKYCPGEAKSRKLWEQQYGEGFYVLMTSRIDKDVKGQNDLFWNGLIEVVKKNKKIKFIFLSWGNSIQEYITQFQSLGLENNFIFLSPVGKVKLIDYYRSCDVVLDQMVYGYYGATALEAASVGKPIIMKLRIEQYNALQNEDVFPVLNVENQQEMNQAILELSLDNEKCEKLGRLCRQWVVRVHGEETTVPLMINLLRLAKDNVKLPQEIQDMNPLKNSLTDEEIAYHKNCEVIQKK